MKNRNSLQQISDYIIPIGMVFIFFLVAGVFIGMAIKEKQTNISDLSHFCDNAKYENKTKYELIYDSPKLEFYIPYNSSQIVYGEAEKNNICVKVHIFSKEKGKWIK